MANWTSPKAYNLKKEEVENFTKTEDPWDGVDWTNKDIYYTEAFERMEKANWKRFVQPEYHDFVDRLDLTKLKQLMKDPL